MTISHRPTDEGRPARRPSRTDRAQHTRRAVLSASVAVGAISLLSSCGTGSESIGEVSGPPKKGGTLRVGITGGSSADSLDAHAATNQGDFARTNNLYEGLCIRDENYKLVYQLAESITPNADATVWTAKLRKGITFSTGDPVTPEDVVFTFERITNPKSPMTAASGMSTLKKVVKTGADTVEFRLSQPNVVFNDSLSQGDSGIVPRGYDPKKPIGTGPFMLDSFTAGQETTLKRNPNYWGKAAYLDKVQLLNFNDDDAVLNALLSSQVDCVASIPLALVKVIDSDPRMNILNSQTGHWLPLTMRVDAKPFDDKRVRQAFRLACDRQQLIDQVLSGFGTLGNDLFAPLDPEGPKIAQRKQDIAQAKKLLAEAGHPNGITVELVTAPINPGVVESAQVFAQQVKEAGITVNIKKVDSTTFYGKGNYLDYPFAQSFWNTRNFFPQADQCAVKAAPFNETHWYDEKFAALISKGKAEPDKAKRKAIIKQAQDMLFDEGGYIIWGFANSVDAYQKYVVGLKKNVTGYPLNRYGFHNVWIGDVK